MSVKVKDRHISKQHCLYKARDLMGYILVLTRPREFDKDGKQICKPGLLGEGQPLQAFELDIIKCGKGIHENKIRHPPFKYLKWNFYLANSNHIIQIPFKKKIAHQRRKLKKMHALWLQGKIKTEEIQQSYQGWRAHISKGTCFILYKIWTITFVHYLKELI